MMRSSGGSPYARLVGSCMETPSQDGALQAFMHTATATHMALPQHRHHGCPSTRSPHVRPRQEQEHVPPRRATLALAPGVLLSVPPLSPIRTRRASAVMGDEGIDRLSQIMTAIQKRRVPQRHAEATSTTWDGGGHGDGSSGGQDQACSPPEQNRQKMQQQKQKEQKGGVYGASVAHGERAGESSAQDGRQAGQAGAGVSGWHDGVESRAVAVGKEDDGVIAARQKAFVKRVGKMGLRRHARDVLDLMDEVERDGSPPFNLYMYNACITALARCGRWRQALAVLDGMRQAATSETGTAADGDGSGTCSRKGFVRPDVVSYSAAITACSRGGQPRRALALLGEMRAEGVHPNVVSYNAAAHACVNHGNGSAGAVRGGRRTHTDNNGYGKTGRRTSAVGGQEGWSLVLGLMDEMRADGIIPDVFTFSTAITACGKAGQWERALALLDEMGARQEDPFAPDLVAINAAIAACGRAGQWERALGLLERMTTRSGKLVGSIGRPFEGDCSPTVGSGYMEAPNGTRRERYTGSDREAGLAAEPLWPVADTVSFNTAMEACATARRWQDGVALLSLMRDAGVRPDIRSYAASLACLRSGGQWEHALELLAEMEAGTQANVSPDLGCYGAVVSTLGEAGEWERAIELLRRLERQGETGTAAWAVTQAADSGLDSERLAAEVTGRAAKSSSPAAGPNLVCYNAALAACAKAGAWSQALSLLQEMEARGVVDTVSFNSAIHACRGQGQWRKATELLARMVRGDAVRGPGATRMSVPAPDAYSFASAITACGAAGQAERAVELLRQMKAAGLAPTVVVFNAAIAAFIRGVNRLDPPERKRDHSRGDSGDSRGGGGGGRRHKRSSARVVDKGTSSEGEPGMDRGDCYSWERARGLLAEMRDEGLVPDAKSYNTILAVCQRAGAWEGALEVLEEMKRGMTKRPAPAPNGGGAPGLWIGAPVPAPDLVSFNTAMGACGRARRWEEALSLLEELPARGFAPDVVSYNTAAAACARGEQWDLAVEVVGRGREAGVIPPATYVGGERDVGEGGSVCERAVEGDYSAKHAESGARAVNASGFYDTLEVMVRRQRLAQPAGEGQDADRSSDSNSRSAGDES